MSITPYPVQCRRDGKWSVVQTEVVSIGMSRLPCAAISCSTPAVGHSARADETSIPGDLLLLRGTCIANEAMLSRESTPLLESTEVLKESTEVRETDERLEI